MIENVITGKFGPRAPDDLPAVLREMADAAERGEITALVLSAIRGNQYEMNFSASLQESLVLATLLHTRAVDKFRG